MGESGRKWEKMGENGRKREKMGENGQNRMFSVIFNRSEIA